MLQRVFLESALRRAFAQDPRGQCQQIARAHPGGPAARSQRLALHIGVEEGRGQQLVLHARAIAHRHEHERAQVEQQRPEHAVGERIPALQAEQLLRAQGRDVERAARDPGMVEPAGPGQFRQQQGVGPDRGADQQPGEGAGTAGAAPVQTADQRWRELRHRREGEQAELRQTVAAQRAAVIGVGEQRDRQDRSASHPQHLAIDRIGAAQRPPPQQQRHDQVVAHHGRQGDAGHDHHAGGGGKPADIGQQGQVLARQRQRQRQHVRVRRDPASTQDVGAGQGDGHHHQRDQHQIGAEHPARRAQVGYVLAFDHRHVELARQAHDRREREQGLRHETARQSGRGHYLRGLQRARAHAAVPRQVQQREHADRHEGEQLDQRFQRHRQHHAAMVFGRVDLAGAEQDREHRQQQGHVQGRVAEGAGAAAGREHFHAHRHRLELQGHVGHRRDHRHRRHQRGQARRAAVARGQEIGDRDDALLAADQHQPFQDPPGEREQQQRAQVDRQEAQPGARRSADRAVEGPRRAVHRQRQRVHRRAQPAPARGERPLVAGIGDREQHADIAGRYQQQHPARDHMRSRSGRSRQCKAGATMRDVRPKSGPAADCAVARAGSGRLAGRCRMPKGDSTGAVDGGVAISGPVRPAVRSGPGACGVEACAGCREGAALPGRRNAPGSRKRAGNPSAGRVRSPAIRS